MKRFVLIPLAAAIACASSSTTPDRREVSTIRVGGEQGGTLQVRNEMESASEVIALPMDKVWAVLPQAFDSLGLSVTGIDPVGRIVASEAVKVRQRLGGVPLSRYFDCGTTQVGANADSYEILITLYAQLKPAAGGTTAILVNYDARARPIARAQAYSDCAAKTHTLDERLIQIVRRLATR